MTSPRTMVNVVAAGAAAGAAILYRFSPQEHSFYPRCPFFALTGHYCPGCGATRAVAELLHGHVAAAVHFNAAVTLLLPVLLWYFALMHRTATRDNRIEWPAVPDWTWKGALACVMAFGVARFFAQTAL